MICSKQHPWGFPWLSNRRTKDANLGNVLIRFTIKVLHVLEQRPFAPDGSLELVFGEHREDLGIIYREEDGVKMQPASIWQLPELDGNRRIRVRDRMRFPLIDDAAAVLRQVEEERREKRKVVRFSVL